MPMTFINEESLVSVRASLTFFPWVELVREMPQPLQHL